MRRSSPAQRDFTQDPLSLFHPAVQDWFRASFPGPTSPQRLGWPPIVRGESTLIVAPTGTGKTLAAFLWCLERLMFERAPAQRSRCRILYVSPLKALAVDVERNLRAPLAGITQAARARAGAFSLPSVAIRTGDTPAAERSRFGREPSDILITTPESLYLLLTSNAREVLRPVDTLILDEIHALVPNKRGAHLALSLERLEHLCGRPLQRIGLSATQRPIEEVARFLGGATPPRTDHPTRQSRAGRGRSSRRTESSRLGRGDDAFVSPSAPDVSEVTYRPVTLIDTGERKALELTVEVPVEDMARIGGFEAIPSGPSAAASQGPARTSIWSAIHPRLVELIRAHRSTLLFVNSRRLAERLAGALNDVAGEPLVRAHHGSLAREERLVVEDQLKAGTLRGLVATSSLELGIDMGAIDLVIEIEAPPSVASGLQRIGRGGHQAGATSVGIIFPKYRGDLVACAASTRAMLEGRIESVRYPRLPLDVLAQQIVAMVAVEDWHVDDLLAMVRHAAPFTDLSREMFEGVLDMLAGRYPSNEFAELRPRLNWDRRTNTLSARAGARRLAVTNGGTIPDRGLYGVFRAGAAKGAARVGELDEEMVFESRVGETFVLGASTWRIEEITHDRVLVAPAPGEPGKMPFWHGDHFGRPLEFGLAIGELVRTLRATPPPVAITRLVREHALDETAAENLLAYLSEQAAATGGAVPDDETLVIERCRDEMGDWRVCVLSPFGSRVHAPWSMAATARIRVAGSFAETDVETLWTDDGFVVRLPDMDQPPDASLLLPEPGEVESLVAQQLGRTAVFAARFREAAARALLLPRRRPGKRWPLWQQRKRAADLMAVASQYPSFPLLLETYRECLRDVFDMPGLVATLNRVRQGSLRVVTVDRDTPSPFAASLMFGYVANFIYDGDAPLAERRAQALTIDQTRLRELLGDLDLRELLDPASVEEVERELQCLDERRRARSADGLRDLLLSLGDLSRSEVAARSASAEVAESIGALTRSRRVVAVPVAGESRYIAAEDAARYRDAFGAPLPPGLPEAFLRAAPGGPGIDPLEDLVGRYARTHGPFTTEDAARRFGIGAAPVKRVLKRLATRGRVLEGAFRPGGPVGEAREWCDAEVLRRIRLRSLAILRRQIEPVEPRTFARLLTHWQGVVKPRASPDALLDAVESLEGAPLVASLVETEILPARVRGYRPGDLDPLLAAGEVAWRGVEPLGDRDGRVALYLADHLEALLPRGDGARVTGSGASGPGEGATTAPSPTSSPQPRSRLILEFLRRNGASFFIAIHRAAGGGYSSETIDALWDLVWQGLVTNDSFGALRAFLERPARRNRVPLAQLYSRRADRAASMTPPRARGRWGLVEALVPALRSATDRASALARTLLHRYGVLVREAPAAEAIDGGFSTVYPVLKAMEESARIRRGMFVAGLGATQFAEPAALELLRSLAQEPETPEAVELAATDPASPWGALLKWPESEAALARTAGASVILINGALAAYLRSGNPEIQVFLPDVEPGRSQVARAVAGALCRRAQREHARTSEDRELGLRRDPRRGLLISKINGLAATQHPLAHFLEEAGLAPGARGYHLPRPVREASRATAG